MPDDKTKVGKPDRSRVSADQDYEVRNIAEKFRLTVDQVRELMLRVGNDRDDVEKAARELSGRSQGRSNRK
jgi:hypothetical protein